MRLILLIVALAGIAVGLVHLRRSEISVRHEIQQVEIQRIQLRREAAGQEVRIGHLLAPESLRRRVARLKRQTPDRDHRVALRPGPTRNQD